MKMAQIVLVLMLPACTLFDSPSAQPLEKSLYIDDLDSSMGRQELDELFGEKNFRKTFVEAGEGECYEGATYLANTPRELEIIWANDAQNAVASFGFVGTEWRTRSGLRLGLSLKEIEKLNGSQFNLTGFAWDYAGTVLDFGKRGKLRKGSLIVRLDPEIVDEKARDLANQVTGDREFSSSHPAMQRLNPTIYELKLHLKESKQRSSLCPGN